MPVDSQIKISKNFYTLIIIVIISINNYCMTDKQNCYSHASDSFKACIFRLQLMKAISSEKVDDNDLLYTSCSSYVSKELSCPDEDNTLPKNPKR